MRVSLNGFRHHLATMRWLEGHRQYAMNADRTVFAQLMAQAPDKTL